MAIKSWFGLSESAVRPGNVYQACTYCRIGNFIRIVHATPTSASLHGLFFTTSNGTTAGGNGLAKVIAGSVRWRKMCWGL